MQRKQAPLVAARWLCFETEVLSFGSSEVQEADIEITGTCHTLTGVNS
jgi:hypothetical protein